MPYRQWAISALASGKWHVLRTHKIPFSVSANVRERLGMGSFTVTPLRILIVDDHDVIRGGLRSLLESRPNWEVCGEATTSLQAIEQTKALRPDVVVLDISMPGSSGLEAIPVIRKETPRPEVLILSRHEEREMRDRAIEAGARDYIPKSQALARDLLHAIDNIVRERSALAG
jgi:DNA-binding NarL/FixJ family response regulator